MVCLVEPRKMQGEITCIIVAHGIAVTMTGVLEDFCPTQYTVEKKRMLSISKVWAPGAS